MISPDTIALVRDRTDLIAVITESVPSLKRRGRSWVGLCPFHKEKTPSFHVNPDRGFFKCFGCGESGDAITFAMREFGYTFSEAVRVLAERVGIVIEEDARERTEVDRAKKQKDDLFAANQLAATFFEQQLREHPLRSFALDELARRGIVPGENAVADEALKAFKVGYAPLEWEGLATFFRQQGISPVAAESVGLLVPRASGSHYDRFRHRLMFAVLDTQGRVVAFSGRALAEPPGAPPKPDGEKPAKYINSKESPIYTKGNVLFGLFQARQAIRTEEIALVVEGNFDVLSLHARGLENVVAPLGTAFTIDQAKLLKRFAAEGRPPLRRRRGRAQGDAGVAGAVHGSGALGARSPSLPDGDRPRRLRAKEWRRRAEGRSSPTPGHARVPDRRGARRVLRRRRRPRAPRARRADRRSSSPSEDDPLVRMLAKGYADSVAGRLDILGVTSSAPWSRR